MVLTSTYKIQKWKLIHVTTFCRYNDFNNAVNSEEDCLLDLFPLQVRISVSGETSSLVATISQKVELMLCLF